MTKQPFSFETYVVDSLKEINKKMDELGTIFVPRGEIVLMFKERDERLTEHTAHIKILERRNDLKNTLLWVGLVASSIINIIIIYQLFTGK